MTSSSSVTNPLKAFTIIALGLTVAVMGIYISKADDAPGAAIIGFLLMAAAVLLGVRIARNRLPTWARRVALTAGVLIAALAAGLTHVFTVAAPLFAQAPDVPSASAPGPSPPWAAAVDRARPIVRAAIMEQNLPGVSVAVGANGGVVWAEGFGWRDVGTQTPVTPDTRFVIGTAAPVITAVAVGSLGRTGTGAESAVAWSPEQIGEPGEDFPVFTIVRHAIFQPLGLAPAEYPLPDDRATFYVPRSDDHDPRRGRRLMYMRDLACCADGMASYSTPSDLVRAALDTSVDDVTGELAGGSVMSLVTRGGIVAAVASNVAYADTAALALAVVDAFTAP